VFTRTRHCSLSWARWIQSTPSHPNFLRSILILSSHERLFLLCGLFPLGFPTKILYAFLTYPMHALCPAYLILLDLKSTLWSSSLCSLLQFSATSALLGPNILLSTLFSSTLYVFSSLSVKDQVSDPCKTTGEIVVLYILVVFREKSWRLKILKTIIASISPPPEFNLPLISSLMQFLICSCCSQLFELHHIFKGFIRSQ